MMNTGIEGFRGQSAHQMIQEVVLDTNIGGSVSGSNYRYWHIPQGYDHLEVIIFLPKNTRADWLDEVYVAYNDGLISGATTITYKSTYTWNNTMSRTFFDAGLLSPVSPGINPGVYSACHIHAFIFGVSQEYYAPRIFSKQVGNMNSDNPAGASIAESVVHVLWPATIQKQNCSILFFAQTGIPQRFSRVIIYGWRKARLMIVE